MSTEALFLLQKHSSVENAKTRVERKLERPDEVWSSRTSKHEPDRNIHAFLQFSSGNSIMLPWRVRNPLIRAHLLKFEASNMLKGGWKGLEELTSLELGFGIAR